MRIKDMQCGSVGYIVSWAIDVFENNTYVNINHHVYEASSREAPLKITKLDRIYFDRNEWTRMGDITKLNQYHEPVFPNVSPGNSKMRIKDMKVGEVGWTYPWSVIFVTLLDHYFINQEASVFPEASGTHTLKVLRIPNYVVISGTQKEFHSTGSSLGDTYIPAIVSQHGLLSVLKNEFEKQGEQRRNKWLITLEDDEQVTCFADFFSFYQGDAYFKNNTDKQYITALVAFYRNVKSVVQQ